MNPVHAAYRRIRAANPHITAGETLSDARHDVLMAPLVAQWTTYTDTAHLDRDGWHLTLYTAEDLDPDIALDPPGTFTDDADDAVVSPLFTGSNARFYRTRMGVAATAAMNRAAGMARHVAWLVAIEDGKKAALTYSGDFYPVTVTVTARRCGIQLGEASLHNVAGGDLAAIIAAAESHGLPHQAIAAARATLADLNRAPATA